jgi:hypothetical protein
MLSTVQDGYSSDSKTYGEQAFAETPFALPGLREQEQSRRKSPVGESLTRNWEFNTPFLPGELTEAAGAEQKGPAVAEFSDCDLNRCRCRSSREAPLQQRRRKGSAFQPDY